MSLARILLTGLLALALAIGAASTAAARNGFSYMAVPGWGGFYPYAGFYAAEMGSLPPYSNGPAFSYYVAPGPLRQ